MSLASKPSPAPTIAIAPEVLEAITNFIDVLGVELWASQNPLRRMVGLILRAHSRDITNFLADKVISSRPEVAAQILKGYTDGTFE